MSKDRQLIIVEARPELLRLNFVCGEAGATIDCCDAVTIAPNDPNSEESSLLDQLALDAAADAIRERCEWRSAQMIVIVGGSDVACHYFSMPNLEGKALSEAVRLKLAQQMHFSPSESVVDISRTCGDEATHGDTLGVCATAVRRNVAEAAVAFALQTKHGLLGITSSAVALTRLAQSIAAGGDETAKATLYIDQNYSTLVVIGESGPILTTEMPVGVEDFTSALMRPIIAGDDVHQLDEAQALELRNRVGIPDRDDDIGIHNLKGKSLLPLLEPALQRFAQQLTQWLTFATTADGGGEVKHMHVVGAGAKMPGLGESLGKRLKIDVDRPDWLQQHGPSQTSSDGESFAASCAVAKFLGDLPDLLPEQERKRRRIARVRNSTTKAGPIIAAATLGVAFLFNQIGGHLSNAVGQVQTEMVRVQSMVSENTKLQQERAAIDALKARFDTFARQTPNWVGLFKELSIILPKEIRVTRMTTRNDGAAIRVVIDGEVARSHRGESYDQSVELALTALERSPFASAVRLVNSSRADGEQGDVEGTMSVEVSLAYEMPPASEEQ